MKLHERTPYFKWGVTIFLTGAALIVFFFFAESVGNVARYIPKFLDVCMPFVIGFLMAYLVCPLYNAIVRRMRAWLMKKRTEEQAMKIAKPIGLAASCIFSLLILVGLAYLVLPELIASISDLIVTLPDTYDSIVKWMSLKAEKYNIIGPIEQIFENSNETLIGWATDKLLPASATLVDGVSAGILGFLGTAFDMLVGFIAMIYIIASKDNFLAASRRLVFCFFEKRTANKVLNASAFINRTFMKFISANLMDGLIIGLATFIVMTIGGWEYVMLISVFVGVTNLIPFFGPFIGGIPSAALLLTVNPTHCLYFIIYIVIIQQIDGNVIKPKIFGEGVGIPSFWVMFSIIVGGGVFGFVGMLIGVPVCACIIEYVNYKVNIKMRKKNLSYDLDSYSDPDFYEMKETRFGRRVSKLLGREYIEKDSEDKNDDND